MRAPDTTGAARPRDAGSAPKIERPASELNSKTTFRPSLPQGCSVAKTPLDRLAWIGQVQGHPDSTPEDVATAATVARFINSKVGNTFVRFDVLARILRVNRRAIFRRLSRLAERGHLCIRRNGPRPATITAILLPDCIPAIENEVRLVCTSWDEKEAHMIYTSFPQSEMQSTVTSSAKKEVQTGDQKRCKNRFWNDAKSGSCDARTREEQGNAAGVAECCASRRPGFSVNATDEFPDDFWRRYEDCQPLFDEAAPLGAPPPIETEGLADAAALESTKPEPEGWAEFASQRDDDGAPDARLSEFVWGTL